MTDNTIESVLDGDVADIDGVGAPSPNDGPDSVPLPPPDAEEHTTACDYCVVGCGYKVYTWPVGSENGGPAADENALGKEFPTDVMSGWISPNMYNRISVDGERHHVVVVPDPDTEVVNKNGDHSARGGTLARKLYNPNTRTEERLETPHLRVSGELQPISWDQATRIVAEVGNHVLDEHGELQWGMKTFNYAYWENTYAITKLAFDAVETPMWAPHEQTSDGSTTPGLSVAGLYPFAPSYEDWGEADILFASGAEIYETHSIIFNEFVMPGGVDLVSVNPRESPTSAYAADQENGMHVEVEPGTDAILNNALARYIIEQGWEDTEWIESQTADEGDLAEETGLAAEMGMTFDGYREFLVSDDLYSVEGAAEKTGVPADEIREVAATLAKPDENGERPNVSFMIEKGNYWSLNWPNTASFAGLGLVCGAGGRPGRMIGRAGGHQRGMMKATEMPVEKSPHERDGEKVPPDLDKWFAEGNLRFMWAIGVTWSPAMGASQFLSQQIEDRTRRVPEDQRVSSFDTDAIIETLKRRADAGNMVLVQQDIYPNNLSDKADLILPASGWGEQDLARMQGERRLRLYEGFSDPPGDAKADWRIIADVASEMGFDGFDWDDANEVFEEAAASSSGAQNDYTALVELAAEEGKTGHEKLREFGTTGIQTPIRRDGDELVGTSRVHTTERDHLAPDGERGFATASGQAVFPKGDWRTDEDFWEEQRPGDDEFWLIDGRFNMDWQSKFDDVRKEYNAKRMPKHSVVINPADAERLGIETADWVSLESEVQTQLEGVTYDASISALAYVTDEMPEGIVFDYFLSKGNPSNSFTDGRTDDVSNFYRFKTKSVRLERLGSSGYADDITFTDRNVL